MASYDYPMQITIIFLSSSGVERSAVNRFVVGSNPTWGVRISYKGNTLAFQAKAAGSSPAIRFFIVN